MDRPQAVRTGSHTCSTHTRNTGDPAGQRAQSSAARLSLFVWMNGHAHLTCVGDACDDTIIGLITENDESACWGEEFGGMWCEGTMSPLRSRKVRSWFVIRTSGGESAAVPYLYLLKTLSNKGLSTRCSHLWVSNCWEPINRIYYFYPILLCLENPNSGSLGKGGGSQVVDE